MNSSSQQRLLLTKEDLQALTGYARATPQAKWLSEKGIAHRVDRRRVLVAHCHVLDWLEGKTVATSAGPNWAALK